MWSFLGWGRSARELPLVREPLLSEPSPSQSPSTVRSRDMSFQGLVPTGREQSFLQITPKQKQDLDNIRKLLNSMDCKSDKSIYELADAIVLRGLPKDSLQKELKKTMNQGCDSIEEVDFMISLLDEKKNVYQCALISALESQFPNENTEIINEVKNQLTVENKTNFYLALSKWEKDEIQQGNTQENVKTVVERIKKAIETQEKN